MTDPPNGDKKDASNWVAVGSVLGMGIGAAIGAIFGDLGTGNWIAVIGVGFGLLMMQLRR